MIFPVYGWNGDWASNLEQPIGMIWITMITIAVFGTIEIYRV